MSKIPDAVELETDALVEYVLEYQGAYGEWDVMVPDTVDKSDVVREVDRSSVIDVETQESEIRVFGKFEVEEVVDRIPASGGGKLEPPTNPPEYVTEPVSIVYSISLQFGAVPDVAGVIHPE